MVRTVFILYLGFFLFCSCRTKEENFNRQHINIKNYINQLIEQKTIRPFNGVILIVENGDTIYKTAQGFSDFRNQIKNEMNTQFCIASLGKQITATLVLKLEEQEKLKVSDTINKFLPTLPAELKNNVTIHQLLSHTSGLKGFTIEDKPGTVFNYSNYGYNLLGKIIEKAGNETYSNQALALFKELGMANTTTAFAYKNGTLANGYNGEEGIGLTKIDNLLEHLQSKNIGIPAGGIISTAKDLIIWNESLHNGKILKPETYAKMITPHAERKSDIWGLTDYGYGLQSAKKTPREYYHAGYVKGFPSANLYFPDTKTSVILLENVSNSQKDISYVFDFQSKIETFMEALQATETAFLEME